MDEVVKEVKYTIEQVGEIDWIVCAVAPVAISGRVDFVGKSGMSIEGVHGENVPS